MRADAGREAQTVRPSSSESSWFGSSGSHRSASAKSPLPSAVIQNEPKMTDRTSESKRQSPRGNSSEATVRVFGQGPSVDLRGRRAPRPHRSSGHESFRSARSPNRSPEKIGLQIRPNGAVRPEDEPVRDRWMRRSNQPVRISERASFGRWVVGTRSRRVQKLRRRFRMSPRSRPSATPGYARHTRHAVQSTTRAVNCFRCTSGFGKDLRRAYRIKPRSPDGYQGHL